MALDEVQQLLFGVEIIVKASQRDTAQAGEVAHGSALVSLVREDFGRIVKNLGETAIEAGVSARERVSRTRVGLEVDMTKTAVHPHRRKKFERSF